MADMRAGSNIFVLKKNGLIFPLRLVTKCRTISRCGELRHEGPSFALFMKNLISSNIALSPE